MEPSGAGITGVGLTNDVYGDGVVEPMFTADVTTDPTRVTVQLTTASDTIEPRTDEPVRFTISSEVALRNAG